MIRAKEGLGENRVTAKGFGGAGWLGRGEAYTAGDTSTSWQTASISASQSEWGSRKQ